MKKKRRRSCNFIRACCVLKCECPYTVSASCSFNSHFFQFLKSAVQKKFMSQMPGENNGNRVNDGKSNYNYIGDNSSRSYKSDSSGERYDEGEIKATMDWTFESSESGSAYSEFS